jgi:hypothetical protein
MPPVMHTWHSRVEDSEAWGCSRTGLALHILCLGLTAVLHALTCLLPPAAVSVPVDLPMSLTSPMLGL